MGASLPSLRCSQDAGCNDMAVGVLMLMLSLGGKATKHSTADANANFHFSLHPHHVLPRHTHSFYVRIPFIFTSIVGGGFWGPRRSLDLGSTVSYDFGICVFIVSARMALKLGVGVGIGWVLSLLCVVERDDHGSTD